MNQLQGKTALITGGARGIGASIAEKFLAEGAAKLFLLDMDEAQLAITAAALDPEGNRVVTATCDVSSSEQTAQAVAAAHAALGRIDVLVNNAGIIRDAMFHKMTDEQWDTVLAVNLTGTKHMTRHVLPLMREQGSGSIINITSIVASGGPGQANYAASKAGVIGFTKAIALEGGRKNIRANTISPGYVDTDILKVVPPDILQKLIEQVPMGRLGKPEEIASVAAFLAGDESSFITGQNIIVSGGANT